MRRWSTFFIGLVLVGCLESQVYNLDAVARPTLTGHTLAYQLRLETLYFSPGVLTQQEGSALLIQIVRCKIGNKCATDIISQVRNGQTLIELPGGWTGPVYLVGGNGERRLVGEDRD